MRFGRTHQVLHSQSQASRRHFQSKSIHFTVAISIVVLKALKQ